jgi:hypothetical protein
MPLPSRAVAAQAATNISFFFMGDPLSVWYLILRAISGSRDL